MLVAKVKQEVTKVFLLLLLLSELYFTGHCYGSYLSSPF